MEKLNPGITDNLQTEAEALAVRIALGRRLQQLKGNDGWLALQEMCRDRLRVSEHVLENFQKYEHRGVDVALSQKQNLTWFMSVVDDFEANEAALTLALAEKQKQINERRAREQKQPNQG
jgi:hypothetical protein